MRVFPRRAFLVVGALGVFAGMAHGQGTRVLPQNVVVGELGGFQYPYVKIGDKVWRLAPGSRIRDRDNRMVVPASAPQSGRIAYNFDSLGQVLGIWILTDVELPYYPLPKE